MSYIEQNLMNGENVLYQARLHWVIFLWPAIIFIIAIMYCIVGGEGAVFGGLLIFIGIITGVISIIKYRTSEFGITNKRVIVKVGFISRNSLEVLLNKVEGIQVNQDILGRIFDYGSITISGTGGTKDPFHKIEAPFDFRKKAQEQIAAIQDSK